MGMDGIDQNCYGRGQDWSNLQQGAGLVKLAMGDVRIGQTWRQKWPRLIKLGTKWPGLVRPAMGGARIGQT